MSPLPSPKPRTIAVAVTALFAGALLDRAWILVTKPNLVSTTPTSQTPTLEKDAVTSSQAATASLTSPPTKPSSQTTDNSQNVDEQLRTILGDLYDPEEESKIEQAIHAPLPQVGTRTETRQPDGALEEYFVASDGSNSYRHKNSQGRILREGWTTAEGDHYYRTFYKGGESKLLSIDRANETQTTITFDDDGNRDGRFDRRSEDQSVSIVYDPSGKIREVWQIGRDDKSERLFPN